MRRNRLIMGFVLAGFLVPAGAVSYAGDGGPDGLDGWWGTARRRIGKILESQGRLEEALESPKWWEQPYNTVGRMPLIDLCLARPLLMPEVAAFADRRAREADGNLEKLLHLARELSDGCAHPPLKDFLLEVTDARPLPDDLRDVEAALSNAPFHDRLPADLKSALFLLLTATAVSHELREEALAGLSPGERARLAVLLPAYFVRETPGGETVRGYTTNVDDCVELTRLLGGVDFAKLLRAARLVAGGVEAFRAAWASRPAAGLAAGKGGILFEAETSFGRVVVGGTEANTHRGACALLVDFGGDDLYLDGPAAAHPLGPGASVLIDAGGNDRYLAGGRAQACAMAGTAALADLGGDDVYVSGHYSQGAALCGASFFLEAGGDDSYVGGLGVQGFSIFGLSVFAERGGRDSYRCAAMGQGSASTLGVTILAEAGGDDTYRAGGKYGFYTGWDSSCAQGAASGMRPWPTYGKITVYGGIGFLSEAGGNDTYHAYNIGQGGSYLFALGMLVDSGGDDTYAGKNYTRGVGVHLSAGVCVDRAGNDLHLGDYGQNGMSLDRSAGVFLDLDGDDVYRAVSGMGYATKPRGCAVFLDAQGDDVYGKGRDLCGHPHPPYGEDAESTALFFDLGGRDAYPKAKYANDSVWTERIFGRGEDASLSGPDGDGGPAWSLPAAGKPLADSAWLEGLTSPVTLVRFAAFRRLEAEPDAGQHLLLSRVARAGHAHARRDLVDALRIRLLGEGMGEKEVSKWRPLLDSPDRELRLLGLHLMSERPTKDPALVRRASALALSDPSRDVRGMACLALGESGAKEALPALLQALRCPWWGVRRRAAVALGELGFEEAGEALVSASASDPVAGVRGRAAAALGAIGSKAYLPAIEARLVDEGEVARFFAARSLVKDHGRLAGMDHLVSLLRWRGGPLKDRLLGRFLRAYTGRSLPLREPAWRAWWEDARGSFDGAKHAEIFGLFEKAEEAKREGREDRALSLYREVRTRMPRHAGACGEVSTMLNGRAWGAAVSGENLEQGLAWAKESVEAKAEVNNVDTLSVLQYLTGRKAEAIKTLQDALEKGLGGDGELLRHRLAELRSGTLKLG